MSTTRGRTAIPIALLVLGSLLPASTATAGWMGDYLPTIMYSTWTYDNVNDPDPPYQESVFEYFQYEGQPAVRLGTPEYHTILWNTGRTITVYAEVDDGELYPLAEPSELGEFADGALFEFCPTAACDSILVRVWDAIDPALQDLYAVDPGWDDLIVLVSYDANYSPNLNNTVFLSNLPPGATVPAGAVTHMEWYQRDVGMVDLIDIDAATGGWEVREVLVDHAIGVSDGTVPPSVIRLLRNQPNPFNPATTIRYDLAEPAIVTLRVFDARGRLAATLVAGESTSAGPHTLTWDGRDDRGRDLPSGVYHCRLQAGRETRGLRMVLVR